MQLRPNENGLLDVVMSGGVVQETGLETVILSSILTNRRASPQDILPLQYQGKNRGISDDRQGWVGDVLDEDSHLLGSKLWLLDRELNTNDTRLRAIEYIEAALQWTIDAGYISRIAFDAEIDLPVRLNIRVDLYLTNGNVLSLRFNYETGAVYVL